MKELFDLNSNFFQGDKSVRVMRSLLAAQQTFVDKLVQLMKAVQRESGNRKKKVIVEKKKSQHLPRGSQSLDGYYTIFLHFSLCVCEQAERLQALLADNEKVNLSEIEPIPLPLEPQIRIRGIVPETATLFKVQKRVLVRAAFSDPLYSPEFVHQLAG